MDIGNHAKCSSASVLRVKSIIFDFLQRKRRKPEEHNLGKKVNNRKVCEIWEDDKMINVYFGFLKLTTSGRTML